MIQQERVPRVVYQFSIHAKHEKDLQLAQLVLLNLGFLDSDLISSLSKSKPALSIFNEKEDRLKKIKKLFLKLKLPGLKVYLIKLKPKDWLTLWKTQWKPARLTKKLDVVPVWFKDKYKPPRGRDYILMDTLLSFGTGLHETTRFMARFIEEKRGCLKSFFDIGTGTGILALVALKNGAEDVRGVDIGELSVQASRDNMKANQLFFKVGKADISKYKIQKKFDFVAANLVTEDLIAHQHKIVSFVKEDGFLAVSGISLENLARLQKSFFTLPLKLLKISRGKQWSGILYQKTR